MAFAVRLLVHNTFVDQIFGKYLRASPTALDFLPEGFGEEIYNCLDQVRESLETESWDQRWLLIFLCNVRFKKSGCAMLWVGVFHFGVGYSLISSCGDAIACESREV